MGVLIVVIAEDGDDVMVAEVHGLIHRRVPPPAPDTKNFKHKSTSFHLTHLAQRNSLHLHLSRYGFFFFLHVFIKKITKVKCGLGYLSLGTGLTLQASSRKRTTSACPETHKHRVSWPNRVIAMTTTWLYAFHLQRRPRAALSLSRSPSAPCPWRTAQTCTKTEQPSRKEGVRAMWKQPD